jgi:hypothetical protein
LRLDGESVQVHAPRLPTDEHSCTKKS